jgi:hypothetical protein
LHFATLFGVAVETVGAGGSGWVMGGVKDTPSSEPPGEVVDGPGEGIVGELPGEAAGGLLAVVNVCVSPKASCQRFAARSR